MCIAEEQSGGDLSVLGRMKEYEQRSEGNSESTKSKKH